MKSILIISATLALVSYASAFNRSLVNASIERGFFDDMFGDRPSRPSGHNSRPKPADRPSKPAGRPSRPSQGSGGSVKCGKQADNHQPSINEMTRIINGQEAVPNSWPWLVSYQVDMGNGMGAMCGANLIRVSDSVEQSDILLTAAHCVTKEESQGTHPQAWPARQLSVTAGLHRRRQRTQGLQPREVSEVRFHPKFKFSPRSGANNDLAIVKLSEPLDFTDTVRPICLPAEGEALPVGKTCVAAGWGRINPNGHDTAEALQQVVAPAQSASTCSNSWRSAYIENQMVCAGSLQGDSGTCQGDSGGMLACDDNGSWKLYGTTSFGVAGTCLEEGKPGIFARVSSYIDWVNQNVQELTSVGK